jgi:hypothetical protein
MKKNNFESELLQKLNSIERNHRVEELVYNDYYIWPIIKIKLYFEILTRHSSAGNKGVHSSLISRMFSYLVSGLKFLVLELANFKMLQKTDVLIFADPFNRRVDVLNKKYEVYVDSIYDELLEINKKCLVIERNASAQYLRPCYSRSFPQFLIQLAFSPFMLKPVSLSQNICTILNEIGEDLKLSGYTANTVTIPSIKKIIRIFDTHLNMYSFIYSICKPKIVILTEWYSIISCACIAAAKKAKIKTVEVQHGVQTETHIAYGNWIKNSSQYINPFPDIFWVWSDADKVNIDNTFSKFAAKSFLGGNLFLESYLSSKITLNGEKEIEPLLKLNKKICLVTLQPNYELHDSIMEYISLIKSDYVFLFRKHPLINKSSEVFISQIKSKFPELVFDIEISSKIPLFILLKYSSLHLTYNSSTVLEAENFNVPTIIFDTDVATSLYEKQIKAGICKLYQNSKIEFSDNLNQNRKYKIQKVQELFSS